MFLVMKGEKKVGKGQEESKLQISALSEKEDKTKYIYVGIKNSTRTARNA